MPRASAISSALHAKSSSSCHDGGDDGGDDENRRCLASNSSCPAVEEELDRLIDEEPVEELDMFIDEADESLDGKVWSRSISTLTSW